MAQHLQDVLALIEAEQRGKEKEREEKEKEKAKSAGNLRGEER